MVDHRGKQVLHVGAESRSVQSNVTAENAAAELAESGNERADAHAAQGQVGLTGLTAQAFYRGGGVMADAVDRKARDIRTADVATSARLMRPGSKPARSSMPPSWCSSSIAVRSAKARSRCTSPGRPPT